MITPDVRKLDSPVTQYSSPEIIEIGGKAYEEVHELLGEEGPAAGLSVQFMGDEVSVLWRFHPSADDEAGFSSVFELSIAAHFVEDDMTLGVLGSPSTATRKCRLCLSTPRSSLGQPTVVERHGREGWPLQSAKSLGFDPKLGQFFIVWAPADMIDQLVRAASVTGNLKNFLMSVTLETIFVERKKRPHGVIAEPLWIRDACSGWLERLSFENTAQALNASSPLPWQIVALLKVMGRIWSLLLLMAIVLTVAIMSHWLK